MSAACPFCGWTHVAGEVVALSRFAGVTGYRTPDGQVHATREDAQEWICRARRPNSPDSHEWLGMER